MTAIVFDIAILALLLLSAWRGAHKGLLLSLLGLVAVLVAFIGASIVSDALAPKVANYLEPKFAQTIQETLDEQLHTALPTPNSGQLPNSGEVPDIPLTELLNALKSMGLYQSAIDAINKAVESGMTNVAAGAAAAVAASIAETVAHMLLFSITFTIVLTLWSVISHALNLMTKLPGLHALNKTGGALLGLVKACIFLFVAAWVLRYLGNIIPEETVNETHLLKFFLTTNPVALLFGG